MTLYTRLIRGAAEPGDDDTVVRLLALTAERSAGKGKPFAIGIHNADGIVYRTVVAEGWNQFIELGETLQALGYQDLCDDTADESDRFDAVYSRTGAPSRQGQRHGG